MSDATTPRRSDLSGVLEDLADAVWAQRHLIELLLCKLITANLLLAAGERRFLAHATDDIGRVVARLAVVGRRRAHALVPVAAAWGASPRCLPLSRLSTEAPEPMATVFGDLHADLLALAAEIEEATVQVRELATANLDQIRATLSTLTEPPATSPCACRRGHSHPVIRPIRLDDLR